MALFAYKAINSTGAVVEGNLEVPGEKELDEHFLREGLRPLRVVRPAETDFAAEDALAKIRDFFARKILENDLIAFTRQFAAAYGAGLPVAATLKMLGKQVAHKKFAETLASVAAKIEAGKGLTEAFASFPYYFPSTYLAMLRAGEVSGKLDSVLNQSANLMEAKLLHRERVKSTLLYPKIVLALILITVSVIIIFVIPQFAKFYDRFGAALPLPTQILIQISNFTQAYWWVGAALVPAAIYGAHRFRSSSELMLSWDKYWLRVPIFGLCFTKIELTHFSATFSILLRSGVRITDATRIAVDSMQNSYLRAELGKIIPTLEQGGTLAMALAQIGVVPPLMASMIAIGEESGELDGLLEQVAKLYENETEMLLKKLPTLIEPIVLGVLFVIVLFLAIAVYLPMWKMSSLLKR